MTINVAEMNAFFSKYLGQSVQYNVSNTTKYQCVDWAKCFCYEYLKLGDKGVRKTNWAWGNARDWFAHPEALKYFKAIKNTPTFVPQAGDLCIFGGNSYGHICVATGIGNTRRFVSIDQNVRGKYVSAEYHNYDNFLGVLRLK